MVLVICASQMLGGTIINTSSSVKPTIPVAAPADEVIMQASPPIQPHVNMSVEEIVKLASSRATKATSTFLSSAKTCGLLKGSMSRFVGGLVKETLDMYLLRMTPTAMVQNKQANWLSLFDGTHHINAAPGSWAAAIEKTKATMTPVVVQKAQEEHDKMEANLKLNLTSDLKEQIQTMLVNLKRHTEVKREMLHLNTEQGHPATTEGIAAKAAATAMHYIQEKALAQALVKGMGGGQLAGCYKPMCNLYEVMEKLYRSVHSYQKIEDMEIESIGAAKGEEPYMEGNALYSDIFLQAWLSIATHPQVLPKIKQTTAKRPVAVLGGGRGWHAFFASMVLRTPCTVYGQLKGRNKVCHGLATDQDVKTFNMMNFETPPNHDLLEAEVTGPLIVHVNAHGWHEDLVEKVHEKLEEDILDETIMIGTAFGEGPKYGGQPGERLKGNYWDLFVVTAAFCVPVPYGDRELVYVYQKRQPGDNRPNKVPAGCGSDPPYEAMHPLGAALKSLQGSFEWMAQPGITRILSKVFPMQFAVGQTKKQKLEKKKKPQCEVMNLDSLGGIVAREVESIFAEHMTYA